MKTKHFGLTSEPQTGVVVGAEVTPCGCSCTHWNFNTDHELSLTCEMQQTHRWYRQLFVLLLLAIQIKQKSNTLALPDCA